MGTVAADTLKQARHERRGLRRRVQRHAAAAQPQGAGLGWRVERLHHQLGRHRLAEPGRAHRAARRRRGGLSRLGHHAAHRGAARRVVRGAPTPRRRRRSAATSSSKRCARCPTTRSASTSSRPPTARTSPACSTVSQPSGTCGAHERRRSGQRPQHRGPRRGARLDRRQRAPACPTSTPASGRTPSPPGASTARRATTSSCSAPRASRSRRARAGCRPPSSRRWRGTGGPVLAGFSEYDAVPGNSQQVVPRPAPREGLHPYAAGHTDPHSVLGTASLAAVLGAQGGDGGARRAGHAQAVRRAGGEGLRLQADPRCQGLLRRPRRRRRLAPLALQHGDRARRISAPTGAR